MKQYHVRFHNIHPDKTSICFTWDDNFTRHFSTIAPAFIKRGMRCTFYINPGEEDFASKFLPGYSDLLNKAFEIGSHGFVHDNLCRIPHPDAVSIVKEAISRIEKQFNIYPTTFAFPYHDFNAEILDMVKTFHFETRNTLPHSKRFAIKTDTPYEDMLDAVKEAIANKHSLVFSGHSVIFNIEENQERKNETGYNPILLAHLISLLDFIQTQNETVQVLTFEQAALKEYISRHCDITTDSFTVTRQQLDWLGSFHIDIGKLTQIMSHC